MFKITFNLYGRTKKKNITDDKIRVLKKNTIKFIKTKTK